MVLGKKECWIFVVLWLGMEDIVCLGTSAPLFSQGHGP